MPRPPSAVLAILTEQHLMLRNRIVQCELLADDVDARRMSSRALWEAVDALREALDGHNRFVDCSHLVLIDRLYAGTTTMLRAALIELREHLAEEEQRYLLPRT